MSALLTFFFAFKYALIGLLILVVTALFFFKMVCLSNYSDHADKALDKLAEHIEKTHFKRSRI